MLLLEDVSIIPSYLKIVRNIRDIQDLNNYLKELSLKYVPINESSIYNKHSQKEEMAKSSFSNPLARYMKPIRY